MQLFVISLKHKSLEGEECLIFPWSLVQYGYQQTNVNKQVLNE